MGCEGVAPPREALCIQSSFLSHGPATSLATLFSIPALGSFPSTPFCLSVTALLARLVNLPPLLDSEPVRRDQVCLGHCCVPSTGLPQSSILANCPTTRKHTQPCHTTEGSAGMCLQGGGAGGVLCGLHESLAGRDSPKGCVHLRMLGTSCLVT